MFNKNKIIQVELKTVGKCWKCGKDVNVARGQKVFWHKECRTAGRRLLTNGKMSVRA